MLRPGVVSVESTIIYNDKGFPRYSIVENPQVTTDGSECPILFRVHKDDGTLEANRPMTNQVIDALIDAMLRHRAAYMDQVANSK